VCSDSLKPDRQPLPPETTPESVKLIVKKAYSAANVGNITQTWLKEGPQAFRLATLLEIVNPKTNEFHHYSLKIDQYSRSSKKGWSSKPDKSVRMEGKQPDEIRALHLFLAAIYDGEIEGQYGDLRIITGAEYDKLANILEVIPNIGDSDKLQLVSSIISQLDGKESKFSDFASIFENGDSNVVRHIAAASRMVEYTAAYDELSSLVADPSTPEKKFQKHLEKHPWMFGSEYSELLPRRTWTRDENLDYMLRRTVDGYLEIVEIKTAFPDALFLHDKSHDSYYPSSKLSPVIGQVAHYIEEVERNRDHIIVHDGDDPMKIRARAIVGRDGDADHQAALRKFNSHLFQIEIITYDQLLRIAKRVLDMFGGEPIQMTEQEDGDIPF
tara:strand:+ start:1392 stop:2543 length:1152 start_codon:yes stop_codon:yes gene_type:complete